MMSKKVAGRPRKYPVNLLEVGSDLLIPWSYNARGQAVSLRPVVNAICQEQRRFNKEFMWIVTTKGLYVKRVR